MTTNAPKQISYWRHRLIRLIAGKGYDTIVMPRHPNPLVHGLIIVQMAATYGHLMRALADGEEKERQDKLEAECRKVQEEMERARQELADEVKIH